MTDLRTLLHENTTPSTNTTTSPSLIDEDLARGRTALRRRRARRGSRAGLMAVAVAGVVAFAAQGALPGASSTTAAPPTSSSVLGVATLVAFTGAQPTGFTIDKVPAGWDVQDLTVNQLLLAPAGLANSDTNNFVDKIIVGLTDRPTGVQPVTVNVGAATGELFTMLEPGPTGDPVPGKAKTLYVPQPSGKYLSIQIWDASTWATQQIGELGAGIHPTSAATTTVG